jgi:dUTP pyrophosphatase
MNIEIKITNKSGLPLPAYQTEQSAGMDLLAAINEPITLKPMERKVIPNGINIALPPGYEAQVRARSGLAVKHGITVLNGIGTIDADYRGEVAAILINLGQEDFVIQPGDRIAQLVINKHEVVKWQLVKDLDQTTRGTGGYGSTGVKHAAN